MAILVDHLEARLGTIRGGWAEDQQGRELPFSIVQMRGGGQLPGSTAFSALGLSRHRLQMRESGNPVNMELFMVTHTELAPARIPQALQLIGKGLLDRHAAMVRGDVVRLPAPISESSGMSALYASRPVYFDGDFDEIDIEDGVTVGLMWLIPIWDEEADFVLQHGWPAFESRLESHDPDLLDLSRPSS